MNAFLLSLLFSTSIFAASKPLDVTVSFDNVHYRVHTDKKALVYDGNGGDFRFPLTPCAKKITDPIVGQMQAALKQKSPASATAPAPTTSNEDVKVLSGALKNSIARGSPLGDGLRELPRRISYLYAESQVACRKQ